jgi:hypothetical protein
VEAIGDASNHAGHGGLVVGLGRRRAGIRSAEPCRAGADGVVLDMPRAGLGLRLVQLRLDGAHLRLKREPPVLIAISLVTICANETSATGQELNNRFVIANVCLGPKAGNL